MYSGGMDLLPAAGLAAAAGYLLGSVPFSWIAVRALRGTDLRRVGSGNVGATNASRVLGRAWFPVLFALDAGKGAGAVLLAEGLRPPLEGGAWVPVAAAVGAVLGHLYPLWLGGRGGKAVATGAGVLLALSPWAAAAGGAGFLLAAGATRFVSFGSMVAAVTACGAEVLLGAGRPPAERIPAGSFVLLLACLVLWKHVPNMRRIAAGTEPRIGARPASPPEGGGKEPHRVS